MHLGIPQFQYCRSFNRPTKLNKPPWLPSMQSSTHNNVTCSLIFIRYVNECSAKQSRRHGIPPCCSLISANFFYNYRAWTSCEGTQEPPPPPLLVLTASADGSSAIITVQIPSNIPGSMLVCIKCLLPVTYQGQTWRWLKEWLHARHCTPLAGCCAAARGFYFKTTLYRERKMQKFLFPFKLWKTNLTSPLPCLAVLIYVSRHCDVLECNFGNKLASTHYSTGIPCSILEILEPHHEGGERVFSWSVNGLCLFFVTRNEYK